MNDGPELPGEFVSDELRNDCARFLDELRRLVELRHQPAPESAAWAPGCLSDPQAAPNSRSAQSRQENTSSDGSSSVSHACQRASSDGRQTASHSAHLGISATRSALSAAA
jgi:hypothetical protein